MQNLGLSDSTPKTEGRLKSLFWPTISSDVDVDTLTTQGFWVCTVIAVLTLANTLMGGSLWAILLTAAFYFLGAMGVRERSRVAAVVMFVGYALAGFVTQRLTGSGFGIMQILFLALLLANIRAVWLADKWRSGNQPDESPARMEDTFMDLLSDRMPAAVWPAGRFLFYLVAALVIAGESYVLVAPARIVFSR